MPLIKVDGALKSCAGKTLDLNGAFTAGGSVRTLQLRTISDSTFTIGAGDSMSFSAGSVFDASIIAATLQRTRLVCG